MKKLIATLFISGTIIFGAMAQKVTVDTTRYVTVSLEIPQLQRQRDLRIYLPADYRTSNKKYPVLYMHDAQNLYNKGLNKKQSWNVDSILSALPVNQQAIVVGIDHGGMKRISEYSPYKSDYGSAEGPAYVEFLVQNLKPYIDNHYRTKTDAKHTAIAGSSMGGLISFYATLKYPQIFGAAGVFSPALWINPEINQFVSDAKISPKSRFFFACGDKEGNENEIVLKMDSLLRTKKVSAASMPPPVILKGEEHNEHQWRLEFPGFYAWWIKGW